MTLGEFMAELEIQRALHGPSVPVRARRESGGFGPARARFGALPHEGSCVVVDGAEPHVTAQPLAGRRVEPPL